MTQKTKTCKGCGLTKPASEYYVSYSCKDGLMSRCKPCHREQVDRAGKERTKAKGDSGPGRVLGGADLVPCAACGLRGHAAGDPERCLHGSATQGLGGQAWAGML